MNPKSLGDLVATHAELEQKLIETSGELTPEIEVMLAEFAATAIEVPDRYHFVVERLKSASIEYAKREEEWSNASRSCDRAVEFLNNNLKAAMVAMGTKEIRGQENRFLLVDMPPKMIIKDPALVPQQYLVEEITVVMNKSQMKNDLVRGVPVAGAHLEPVHGLRKYLNKEK